MFIEIVHSNTDLSAGVSEHHNSFANDEISSDSEENDGDEKKRK